jgi:hypothetical protein
MKQVAARGGYRTPTPVAWLSRAMRARKIPPPVEPHRIRDREMMPGL